MSPLRRVGVSMMGHRTPRGAAGNSARSLCLGPLAVWLAGCSGMLYGQTGSVMSGYARDHMVPYLLADDDVGMACQMGASLTGFVASFERVADRPNLPVLVSYVGAGMCAEDAAREAELRFARAVRAGQASEAEDAGRAAERAHLDGARRFYRAWQRAEAHFGSLGDKACPKVSEDEQIYLLLGLSAGMMAVMHDRGAGGAAAVPTSIPPKVARAAACLDNTRWWGVPQALQAAVWLTVPGSGPAGASPADVLETTAAIGDQAGVRLARALQVIALGGAGDAAGLDRAIAAHAAAVAARPAPAQWRLLDAYGTMLTRHAADLRWTRATGARAPTTGWGAPPKLPAKASAEDEAVLEGIED